jgi:hypothetical protein
MQCRIHPGQLSRSRAARLVAVAALMSAILVAGCEGSSPSPTVTAVGSTTTTPSSTAPSKAVANSASTVPGAYGSGPLGFARCMRANGVPAFPDPTPGRGAVRVPVGSNPAAPAFEAAQASCAKLVPGSGPPGSGSGPSAQTMAKLHRIAVCMRQHGVPQFPDPRTAVPSNLSPDGPVSEITDFDGAILVWPRTIDMQAPAYRQALTACGAPPLGLAH